MPDLSATRPTDTIKRVDLSHEMAFAKTADRRVARHDPDRGGGQRHQSGLRTHARHCMGGLCPRMAAADHHHVKLFHVKHPSLAETEAGEYFSENRFYINASYQRIERPNSRMNLCGCKVRQRLAKIEVLMRLLERHQRLAHGEFMTRMGRQSRARGPLLQDIGEPGDKRVYPLSCHDPEIPSRPILKVGLGDEMYITDLCQIRESLALLGEKNPKIGRLRAISCARDPDLFDSVPSLAQTGGVENRNRQAVKVHPHLYHVPRRPGVFRGDCRITPGQPVKKCGFSNIRRANDSHLEPGAHALSDAYPPDLPLQALDDICQQRPHLWRDIYRNLFVGKINRYLEKCKRPEKRLAPDRAFPRQLTRKTAHGLAPLRLGLGGQQVGERLDPREIETSMVQGAPGKFSWFGLAQPGNPAQFT